VEELIFVDLKIVGGTAAAHDRFGTAGPVNPVFDQFVINMDTDHLAQDKPLFERFIGFALELDNLGDPAFELNGAGGTARWRYHVRSRLLEPSQYEFIDVGSDVAELTFIASASSRVARFQTNSRVVRALVTLSFRP